MARYIPDGSCQTLFVDGSLESLLPSTSVARSIRHGLCELDFSRFDAVYHNDDEGRPAIDPRRLSGLWILALLRGVTSSVEVARLCQTDIEFRWLSGDAHVQKSTLSAFRSNNQDALGELSTQLLAALARSDMLPGKELAIDGTVIRAASSCGSSHTRKQLRRRTARLKRIITERYSDGDNLDDSGKRLLKKQHRFERALQEMSKLGLEGDDDRLTITEPDVSVKRLKNGSFGPSHNVQVVTDLGSGAIITTEVIDQKNDGGQLLPQVRQAQQELDRVGEYLEKCVESDRSVKAVVADSAYHDTQQLVTLEKERVKMYVPDDRTRNRRPSGVSEQFGRDKFVYDAETDSMQCPAGELLSRRKSNKDGTVITYQAASSVCHACRHKPECSPHARSGRSVNRPVDADVMKVIADRVDSDRGKQYRQARGVVVEGAIGRLIERLNWRRCRSWGNAGARAETLWRQITHNLLLLIGHWKPLVPKEAPAG